MFYLFQDDYYKLWLHNAVHPTHEGYQKEDPTDHLNIRILPTMVSGIPLLLVLGTRMRDPYACTMKYHTLLYHSILDHIILYHTIKETTL